ncbi:S1 family peptidase [Streptomyces sp. CJ_13]|uniref:trypsin-like serine protease n=1 Tax=Streptomyces sp. CJ_13 TaxID=2724943 RepID=UPI001BDC1623|nr:trypsin-like serine protease [Streptomyces sp. CJ_13]MBT1188047.1 S1 family peptidase [Streptomyces sp. CJ_13]
MDIAGRSSGGDRTSALLAAVAQIIDRDDQVAGAGFLVAEGILATAAHVVRAAGAGPGDDVRLVFPHVDGGRQVEGFVLEEPWRAPEDEDVAIVRLSLGPAGGKGLRIQPCAPSTWASPGKPAGSSCP